MKERGKLLRIILSACIFVAGLFISNPLFKSLTLMAAGLLAGYDVLWEAILGLVHGQWLDENFLMSLAAIGAFLIGEDAEGAAVMVLYQLGEWLEDLAVDRSRGSIEKLMDLRPDTARLENGAKLVAPAQVAIGDRLIVLPGEKIPLDGVVAEGQSRLNEAALTGESRERSVSAGDEVFSGTINSGAKLIIRVTKPYESSTASKILALVESAQERKAHTESLITRFSKVYTPIVVGCALLLFAIPSLITKDVATWSYRALSFLVVSCPCALLVSVPLAFFGGIGLAGRCGILIKGGSVLEALCKADTVAFDKTGTLTEGRFKVRVVHPEKITEQELLCLAARVEAASTHPIAQSILTADGHHHRADEIEQAEEIAGKGVRAVLEGRRVCVGNEALMQEEGLKLPSCPHTGSVIHVSQDGVYLGHIVVSDALKPHAAACIRKLKELKLSHILLLSGDQEESVRQTAKELQIEEAYGRLLPQHKVEIVEEKLNHMDKGKKLIFVGDGINDAPVLMRADAGVAMGAMGSDAAMEAADVVLMNDDPLKLAQAIQICKRTLAIAYECIALALASKLIIMVLSALGLGRLWLAVFGDVGICLLCALNALRARKSIFKNGIICYT